MSQFIAEQHTQWHRIYGKYATCPLDCGSGEGVDAVFEADYEALRESGANGIRCGACKGRHGLVATVKFCYEVKRDAEIFDRREAEEQAAFEAAGDCEHGLSAAFCEGPNHYPVDSSW